MSNKYVEFSKAGNAPTNPNERKKFRKGKKSFKEVKMRPNIDEADLQVKLKQIIKFLDKQLQVRLTLTIRGRQNQYKEECLELFNRVEREVVGLGTMNGGTKSVGSNHMRTINPVSQKKKGSAGQGKNS